MEAVIGVFPSRLGAEQAVEELVRREIPKESISFLTCRENEPRTIASQMGAFVGAFVGLAVGMSLGVEAAILLRAWQGWQLFAMGLAAAIILAFASAAVGRALCKAAVSRPEALDRVRRAPVYDQDATRFRAALKQGQSVIIIRTESQQVASSARGVFDRTGAHIQDRAITGADAA